MTATQKDIETIKDALIILGGYLPYFSDNPRRVKRAEAAGRLKDDAFRALDDIADSLGLDRPVHRTSIVLPTE